MARKNKISPQAPERKEQKPIWLFLERFYSRMQHGWAKKMERWTAGFSKMTWMIALTIFLLLGIASCLYIMYSSF